jgi:hypothetical protein
MHAESRRIEAIVEEQPDNTPYMYVLAVAGDNDYFIANLAQEDVDRVVLRIPL